jgi:hypothetical protein
MCTYIFPICYLTGVSRKRFGRDREGNNPNPLGNHTAT